MSFLRTWHRFPKTCVYMLLALLVYLTLSAVVRAVAPPPNAVAIDFPERDLSTLEFFEDQSWIDAEGNRHLSQTLFNAVFEGIKAAKHLIVVDMFLFNQWQGPVPETHRMLATELSNALVEQQLQFPEMDIVVISDPINTVYGGLSSPHFERLKSAGIHVVLTRLDKLQDSNPLWSGIWRWLIRPWANSEGEALPNPFGEGRVSVRSYLALLNFKANHRKLMIADSGGDALYGWVSSANPHDGSSAHRNVAVRFGGQAAIDLLASESALLAMSNAEHLQPILNTASAKALAALENVEPEASSRDSGIQIISESKILDALIDSINEAKAGSQIDLAMFYLSERTIVKALKRASERGVSVRVLLDVNNDAFGRAKNGVPNRPVAAELVDAGVTVRWCATLGEQCHAKWLHVSGAGTHEFFLGSANFTRRNLRDLNLETNVRIITPANSPIALEMLNFFDNQWSNIDSKQYSEPYNTYADDSLWLTMQYRVMEFTGLSTF